ncbi:MAG: HAMP domain-containing histidine kinase [Dorea sp.]|nr:HAMP domain-containing histidine kinase [Dorea sp.]
MKNRLYKTSTKALLIIISLACSAFMILGFVLAGSYPMDFHSLFDKNITAYENSDDFASEVYSLGDTIGRLSSSPYFKPDGSYDPDAEVDLYEFLFGDGASTDYRYNNELQSATSGKKVPLVYRLGDLINWSANLYESGMMSANTRIIVCKGTDGYDYYPYDEFQRKILNNEFQFIITSSRSDIRTEDLLLGLYDQNYINETMLSLEGDFKGIQDKKGKLLYVDCWSYDGIMIDELYPPVDYDSLMDLVNQEDCWSGNLSRAYDLLECALFAMQETQADFEMFSSFYTRENSNIYYLLADAENQTIYSNNPEWNSYKEEYKYLTGITHSDASNKYVIYDKNGMKETNITSISENAGFQLPPVSGKTLAIVVDTNYPVVDTFSNFHTFYDVYRPLTLYMFYGGIACAILFLICLVLLTIGCGRNVLDQEIHLQRWDHWFTEISAAGVFLIWLLVAGVTYSGLEMGTNLYNIIYHDRMRYMMLEADNDLPLYLTVYALLGVFTMVMFLTGYLSLVRRIKAKTLWKDSILKRLFAWCRKLYQNLGILWKLILVTGIYVGLLLLGFADPYSPLPLLPCLGVIVIFAYLMKFCIGQKKLLQEIQIIAGGEVDHQIDTNSLTSMQKDQADAINHIREGLSIAIEKNLKSERMKTELITNVSHDLKTPLTSIINYVDLLKKENLDNENAVRYLEVLDQKSQQLKKLTEDVIEASKASSGAIILEKMKLDVVELLTQCSGEFAEKFYAKHLVLIENYPESPVLIYADGRRLWRTISNLYSNVSKYALTGSRVYANLETYGGKMVFTLKNISQNELNISADELTERFIRGDISRTTEGSGLGLSIAKSLTEIQGGTFDLYLDGDLFKVTITFPLAS